MIRHKLKKKDFDDHPELHEKGWKIGQVVELSTENVLLADDQTDPDNDGDPGDDIGGSNPDAGGRAGKP